MKELIMVIARALVDYPNEVTIEEIDSGATVILELRVSQTDLGKIIGRKGRTVGAIRLILNAVATKREKRVVLEIIE